MDKLGAFMPFIISRDQDKVTSYHGGYRVYFPKLKLKIHAVRVCVYGHQEYLEQTKLKITPLIRWSHQLAM